MITVHHLNNSRSQRCPERRRAKSSFIEPQIARHLDYMESELAKFRWFAGDEFSAASQLISGM